MKERSEARSRFVRPLRGGQITIPAEFRRQLGITESTMLQVTLTAGELRLRPVRVAAATEGSPWLRELYDRFASVRTEARDATEEEIDTAIQAALNAVRRTHA